MTRTPVSRSKVKSQLVTDVLNSQHAEIGATWRINTKILSTCRGWRHIVAAGRLQLVGIYVVSKNEIADTRVLLCIVWLLRTLM